MCCLRRNRERDSSSILHGGADELFREDLIERHDVEMVKGSVDLLERIASILGNVGFG